MSVLSKTKYVVIPLLHEEVREEVCCLGGDTYEFETLKDAEDFMKNDQYGDGYGVFETIKFVKVQTTAKLITIK